MARRSDNDGEALFSVEVERPAVARLARGLAKHDLSRVSSLLKLVCGVVAWPFIRHPATEGCHRTHPVFQ